MWNPCIAPPRASHLRVLCLVVISALFATPGSAAPLTAPTLHWVRGGDTDTCAEPRALAERVEALIGMPLARAAEAEHTIEALSERTPRGFRVRLRLFARGGRLLGERNLDARQGCAALTAPAAFVIAMMIDPEVVAHGLPPELMALLGEDAPEEQLLAQLEREPARPATPTVPTSTSRGPAPLDQASPEPARAASFQLTLVGGSALFSGPQPAPFGQLLVATFLRPWLSLAASLWGGAQVGAERAGTGSFRLAMANFSALVCAASPGVERIQIAGCLGPALRLRHARGRGFGRDQNTTLLSGSAAALLHVRLRLRGGWGLSALISLDVGFSQARLVYASADGSRSVAHRFARVDLAAGLGATYEF
jgi:hypothetical protein